MRPAARQRRRDRADGRVRPDRRAGGSSTPASRAAPRQTERGPEGRGPLSTCEAGHCWEGRASTLRGSGRGRAERDDRGRQGGTRPSGEARKGVGPGGARPRPDPQVRRATTRWCTVLRHIWLDPERVCYPDYDSDRACTAGPDPWAL